MTLVARSVTSISANERYAFARQTIYKYNPVGEHVVPFKDLGILIDDKTGRRYRLTPPRCGPLLGASLFGGPWLLINCRDAGTQAPLPDLYDLSTHRWTEIPVASGRMCGPLGGPPFGNCDIGGASGVRPLCAPLRFPLPQRIQAGGTRPGWIDMLGHVGLVDAVAPAWAGYSDAFLQPCGQRRRIDIPGFAVSVSAGSVLWATSNFPGIGRTFAGVLLRNLQRVSLTLPARAVNRDSVQLAQTARHLFILPLRDSSSGDPLYSAPAPQTRVGTPSKCKGEDPPTP